MIKSLTFFLTFLIAISMTEAGNTPKGKPAAAAETHKSLIPNPKNVHRPRYKMTVTQDGATLGTMILEIAPDLSPKHAANFDSLVKVGFYNGLAFHRVIPGFMIQGGDPSSKDQPRERWGGGMPGQKAVPAEFNDVHHARGIISAARTSDPNSATSQFFICVADAGFLDHQYTVYGEVVEGMDVADKVVNAPRDSRDNPLKKIEMHVEKLPDTGHDDHKGHKH